MSKDQFPCVLSNLLSSGCRLNLCPVLGARGGKICHLVPVPRQLTVCRAAWEKQLGHDVRSVTHGWREWDHGTRKRAASSLIGDS